MSTARLLILSAAVLGIVFAASAGSARTVTFATPISGDGVPVSIEFTDTTGGDGVDVNLSIPSGVGDLLGLFGNVSDESLVPLLAVADPSGLIAQWQFLPNQVRKVGAGNSMTPVKTWDWGVRIGKAGSAGGAIESASFTLTAPGLDVDQILTAATQGWVLGVRIQSTLGTEGSAKIGLSDQAPRVAITSPAEGNLLVASPVTVEGTVLGSGVAVDVNGVTATVGTGAFQAPVPLTEGANTLTATGSNAFGTATDAVSVVLDTTPPVVTIDTPTDGTLTVDVSLAVAGTATDANPITSVTLNGSPISFSAGAFSGTAALAAGLNTLTVAATDAAGNVGSASVTVTLGEPPTIAIDDPLDGSLVGNSVVTVSGSVTGLPEPTVDVNGVSATVSSGIFTASVPLSEGANALVATATNLAGSASATINVTADTTPPVVSITAPTDGALVSEDTIAVSGTVSDTSAIASVVVNGVPAALAGSNFTATVPLAAGANTITAVATDAAGNQGSAAVSVTFAACTPGDVQTCYDGPAGTEGVGLCLAGTRSCLPDGSGFGSCADQALPAAEVCNGFDDNCDGVADEGFDVAAVCSTGDLGICATGTLACGTGGLICSPDSAPQPETCDDGIDQNCDGRDCKILAVTIDTPTGALVTDAGTVDVFGTVGAGVTSVSVNGFSATLSGAGFDVTVPLDPGRNMLVALAIDDDGNTGTDSVLVTRDTFVPRVVIDSPADGFDAAESRITVTGVVHDLVSGGGDPIVTVNGLEATVQHGTFLVVDVLLVTGPNAIVATATDAVGNQSSDQIQVNFARAAGPRLERLSGDGQAGLVGTPLLDSLVVRMVDGSGNPLASRVIRFEVVRNSGLLSSAGGAVGRSVEVATNGSGVAEASLKLGSRSGEGNNRVRVSAAGVQGEVVFCASGLAGLPDRIDTALGDHQTGMVSSPLPEPLEAQVVDQDLNPVAGVPVTFTVEAGSGTLDGLTQKTVITDSNGFVSAALTLGPNEGLNNSLVTASFAGLTALPASFLATAVAPGLPVDTTFVGIVLDNGNTPIPGATITIDEGSLQTVTDSDGRFVFANVLVGPIHLQVDPSTSPRPETFPSLVFETVAIAGHENRLPTGPISIPALDSAGELAGGSSDVVLQMPEVEGVELTVFANSVTFADGSTTGNVSINQVHLDKVPMPPPMGMLFIPTWTVQPAGTLFDPPARIQVPNTEAMPPGSIVDMFSFDHDLNRFVDIGTGTVTEDGLAVVSDPGFGIEHAGWGGSSARPPTTCGSGCADCEKCDDNGQQCVADSDQDTNACADGPQTFIHQGVTITVADSCKGTCNNGNCEDGNDRRGIDNITKAAKDALDKIFNGCMGEPLRSLTQDALEENGFLIECVDSADATGSQTPGKQNCAAAAVGGNTMTLSNFETSVCGSLAKSIRHEMQHGAGSSGHTEDVGGDTLFACDLACYDTANQLGGNRANCK